LLTEPEDGDVATAVAAIPRRPKRYDMGEDTAKDVERGYSCFCLLLGKTSKDEKETKHLA